MTVRLFTKISFNSQCDNILFLKYSRSVRYGFVSSSNVNKHLFSNNKALAGYFSSKRNFSNIQNNSSYQQVHANLIQGSFVSQKDTGLIRRIPSNRNPVAVNSIRQFSNTPSELVNTAVKYNVGIFKIVSESAPVEWLTEGLRLMHYGVGLPWWASIVFTTIISRALIHFPFSVLDHYTRAKRDNLKPELMEVAKTIKMQLGLEAMTSQLTATRAKILAKHAFMKEQRELYRRENCHPFKSVAILLLQIPVWLSFSVAVRNICYVLPKLNSATLRDYNELKSGGFLWVQNLVEMDHTFVLPILFVLSSLAIIDINHVLYNVQLTKLSKYYTYFIRTVIICLVPFVAYIPSALSLFWVTTNFCAMSQSLLLLSPKVRRLVGIPKTDSELQHPYAELNRRLLGRFNFKKPTAQVQALK